MNSQAPALAFTCTHVHLALTLVLTHVPSLELTDVLMYSHALMYTHMYAYVLTRTHINSCALTRTHVQ